MLVKSVIFYAEGFEAAYALEFENGLLLSTKSMTWMSSSQKREIEGKFAEVLAAIKDGSIILEYE
jgi:hypothetical protein